MGRFVRAVVVALVLHALTLAGLEARESYCRTALEQCITSCERYPGLIGSGCSAGCALMYLSCD